MYESQKSSTTYQIPQCCCTCLGPSDKRLMIVYAREWTHEGVRYRQSYDIDVPICSSCKARVYRRRLLGIAIFLASAAGGWFVWQQEWNEWEIWLTILIVIAGLIVLGYIWFSGLPASIDSSGVVHFENAEYQKRFRELNTSR